VGEKEKKKKKRRSEPSRTGLCDTENNKIKTQKMVVRRNDLLEKKKMKMSNTPIVLLDVFKINIYYDIRDMETYLFSCYTNKKNIYRCEISLHSYAICI